MNSSDEPLGRPTDNHHHHNQSPITEPPNPAESRDPRAVRGTHHRIRHASVTLLLCATAISPALLVYSIHRSALSFDPAAFITEYYKFLSTLIPILLAFYLLNIFWERKTRRQTLNLLHELALTQLDIMGREAWLLGIAFDQPSLDADASLRQEERCHQHIERLAATAVTFHGLRDTAIGLQDICFLRAETQFANDVSPAIGVLQPASGYLPLTDDVREVIRHIGVTIQDLRHRLEKNE